MKIEEIKNKPLPDNLRLRHGIYYADFRIGHRRYRGSLNAKTLALAKQRLKEMIAAAHQGELDHSKEAVLSIHEWADEYVATHLVNRVPQSQAECGRLLRKFIVPFLKPHTPLNQVSIAMLIRMRSELWGKSNPATQNRKFALVKHFFAEARRIKLIKEDPARDVAKLKESPKPSKTLSDMDLKAVLLASGEPLRSFLLLLVSTGLRVGELKKLRWKNVERDPLTNNYWIRLRNEKGFRTKSGRDRNVPVHPKILSTLLSKRETKDPEELVFKPPGSGKFYNPREPWQKVRDRLGLIGVTRHGLRRTFGTVLHRNGVPIGSIQSLYGHSNPSQTRKYIDVLDSDLTVAIQGLDQTLESLSLDNGNEVWSQNGHNGGFSS